ncbi:hypothetical protein FA95DRAFT_1558964 [Auriscalpium vulgare]|uniref:Uncharacterized protein n=1 Tax=Auriscalpium vulgare TaxID=40419 RepID=A0ACB8RUB0_9AGAM|nr:hypothetical protein FA95DRAFT_1558964 [Auriscalpium vulgare]
MHYLIFGGYILREQDARALVRPNQLESDPDEDPLDLFTEFAAWYDLQPKAKQIPIPNSSTCPCRAGVPRPLIRSHWGQIRTREPGVISLPREKLNAPLKRPWRK